MYETITHHTNQCVNFILFLTFWKLDEMEKGYRPQQSHPISRLGPPEKTKGVLPNELVHKLSVN